jgi:branched-chain amino acid aminotransferase
MSPLVILNGDLMPLSEARVPLNDRSFLFGDSLYEVVATRQGKPYFTTDHLERLRATAHGLHLPLPWDNGWFEQQIRTGIDALGAADTYVRIVVSRGSGDFNIDIDAADGQPLAAFIFKPAPVFPAAQWDTGVTLAVPETRRNSPKSLPPAFKTGNYLNNILCLYEAKQQGAEDALILDLEGHVTEATTSNFFMVRDGVLWTAPLSVGILDGITRKYFLQVAQQLNIPVQEALFSLEDVYQADEAFVSSTLKGAMPVHKVNDHVVGTGYGALTRTLNEAYWAYVDAHLDSY